MNRKILILILAVLLGLVCFFSVKAFYIQPEDKRTVITVGCEYSDRLKVYEEEFERQNPDIDVRLISFSYYMQYFDARAISNELPIYFQTWFSEFDRMIKNGCIADITDYVDKEEYLSKINPVLKDIAVRDERIYAIPITAYAIGLSVNEEIFKKAGLIDKNGEALIPETFDDVWEYARIIREKTGDKGLRMHYDGYSAGWHIVNIAWNYGVEFVREEDSIKKSCFDDERLVEIFEILYDLKWKHDAIKYENYVNSQGVPAVEAVETGMRFISDESDSGIKYISLKNHIICKVPAGSGGRYALTGGKIGVISSSATEDQIKACIKWAEFIDELPGEVNEIKSSKTEEEAKAAKENNSYYLRTPELWVDSKSREAVEGLLTKYDMSDERTKHYNDYSDVTLRTEIPVNCQQLYNIINGCFEKVMTDPEVDIPKMIKEANEKFQREYLN